MNHFVITSIIVRCVFALVLAVRGYGNIRSTGLCVDFGLLQWGVAFLLISSAYEMWRLS